MSEARIALTPGNLEQDGFVSSPGRDQAHQLAHDIFAVAIAKQVAKVKTFGNAQVFNSTMSALTFKYIDLRNDSDHYQVDYSVRGKKQRYLSVLKNPIFIKDRNGDDELIDVDEIVVISTYLKEETELPHEYPVGEDYLLLYGDNTTEAKSPEPNSPKAFEMARNMLYVIAQTR